MILQQRETLCRFRQQKRQSQRRQTRFGLCGCAGKIGSRPTCRFEKYPERNRMAQYMARNGMIAFTFDNPETAECALDTEREGDYGNYT